MPVDVELDSTTRAAVLQAIHLLLQDETRPALATIVARNSDVIAGSDTSDLRRPLGYGKPNQSRIWFNAGARRWDAVVPRDDSANNDDAGVSPSDHFIVTDVVGEQRFRNTELESRDFARVDVHWDASRGQLYVLGSHPEVTRLWRLRYDSTGDRYRLELGAPGLGVEVPGMAHPDTELGGSSPAALHVSQGGRVWVSVLGEAGGLQAQVSDDGGASWLSAPVVVDPSARLGVSTWTGLRYAGQNYVGLFYAENGEFQVDTRFAFRYIAEGADPGLAANWVDESAALPEPGGQEMADDHVAAARDVAGNLYFAVKTEGGAPTDPLIAVYKRTPGGEWSRYAVTQTRDVPEQSRPSLVVDSSRNLLSVYLSGAEIVGPSNRAAGRIRAPLDDLAALDRAPFEPLFDEPGVVFTDISTPRHAVDATTGTAVLVHNRSDSTLWFDAERVPPVR